MGDGGNGALRVDFRRGLKLEFCGSRITSDAGLLPYWELDEALGQRLRHLITPYLQVVVILLCGCNGATEDIHTFDGRSDSTDALGDSPVDLIADYYQDDLESFEEPLRDTDSEVACIDDDDCDDHDPCTVDTCSASGSCMHLPVDMDDDGYVATDIDGHDCGGNDCDDSRDDTYPGAPEGCDGTWDHDCDGDATDVDIDVDGDGHAPIYCGGDDCSDEDEDSYPGAPEICDLLDQDCDGLILDVDGIDDDGDGVPDEACGGRDCNDEDASIHGRFVPPYWSTEPAIAGAAEVCDTIDQNCDGRMTDAIGADDDGDGVLDEACGGTDCNDMNRTVHPGAFEYCDDIDNDCDGLILDAIGADDDGDGVLDSDCGGMDCDDTDSTVHPGATEYCDAIDSDCDGSLVDAPGADDDGDTVLDEMCGGTDCDDTRADVYGGAAELCDDGVDQDCDGIVDERIQVDPEVRVTDDPGISNRPLLVSTGSEFGVVWIDDRSSVARVYFTRISQSGAKIGSDIPMRYYSTETLPTDLVWTGSEYGMTFFLSATFLPYYWEWLYFSRFSPTGSLIGTDTMVSPLYEFSVRGSLAWTGSEYGVSWTCWDVRFNRISDTGSIVGSDTSVSTRYIESMHNALAWSGSEYGVVWWDYWDGGVGSIYFNRISSTGAIVGSDVLISNSDSPSNPQITWTGSEYGILWQIGPYRDSELMLARVSPAGTKTGTDVRLSYSATHMSPTFLWTGSEYGLAWECIGCTSTASSEIYLARMDPDGRIIGSDIAVTTDSTSSSTYPSLAWTGSQYGVSWTDDRDGNMEIYFGRITLCEYP